MTNQGGQLLFHAVLELSNSLEAVIICDVAFFCLLTFVYLLVLLLLVRLFTCTLV